MKLKKYALIMIPPALIAATLSSNVSASEVHPKVTAALNWEMPANQCKQPEDINKSTAIINNRNGAKTSYDGDHYQEARHDRKVKRWKKCVSQYKEQLMEEFDSLKNSAQYGLSKPQANTILSKMASIQAVMKSPSGIGKQHNE